MSRCAGIRRSMMVALGLLAGAGSATAPRAEAGTYTVLACDAASVTQNINQSWALDATPGHGPAQTCPTSGDIYRGIATRVVGQTVGSGVFERARLFAPAGATIAGLWWSGRWVRNQCYWTTALMAHPSGASLVGGRAQAGSECLTGQEARAVGFVSAPAGTTGLQQIVQCGNPTCAPGAAFHSFYTSVLVNDPNRPGVAVTAGGLASGRWLRGTQSVSVAALDNVGIRRVALTVGGRAGTAAGYYCNPYLAKPGNNASGSLAFRTTDLPDGTHTARVAATDCANNVGYRDLAVRVDNTPPAQVTATVAGGERWRARDGYSLTWRNAPDALAPIAGLHYRLCGPGGACTQQFEPRPGVQRLAGLAVGAVGDHTLELSLQDEAGNTGPWSAPVHLRHDPVPPVVAFEPTDPADPLRVSALASDSTSGIAGGELEMRRRGGQVWHPLETSLEGPRLVGYVDDERFRSGTFEFRTRAVDRAGNERTTDRQASGAVAALTLPVRFATRLRVGKRRVIKKRSVVRSKGRRRVVRHRSVTYSSPVATRVGGRLRLRGVLTNPDGQQIAGARIDVFARPRYGATALAPVGTASTDRHGQFTYLARGTVSRLLRFHYPGTRQIRSATREVTLVVPASSSLRVSRRHVLNGQQVVFRGRLRGGHVPQAGKLTVLQALVRGRWRTFATPRSDRAGRWRSRYRFTATSGSVRYRFRLCVPRDGGYPFDTGCSRSIAVSVRGL